jgi:hypothetical protein
VIWRRELEHSSSRRTFFFSHGTSFSLIPTYRFVIAYNGLLLLIFCFFVRGCLTFSLGEKNGLPQKAGKIKIKEVAH